MGFVLMTNGEMYIDYWSLDDVYRDKYWSKYKNIYKKLEKWIEDQYSMHSEWSKLDWKIRHREHKQLLNKLESQEKKREEAVTQLYSWEPVNKVLINKFLKEYPRQLHRCATTFETAAIINKILKEGKYKESKLLEDTLEHDLKVAKRQCNNYYTEFG